MESPEPDLAPQQAQVWAEALPDGLRDGWVATVASAGDAHPRWSRESREIPRAAIKAAGRACSLSDDAIAACQELADQVAQNDKLTLIARHLHAKIFPSGEGSLASGAELGEFPVEIAAFGSATATLYLLLYLTGVPALLAHHRERSIPEDVSRSTLSDIDVWVRAHATGTMSPVHQDQQTQRVVGLRNLSWPMHSLNGNILRVGRFQHRRGTFNAPFEVYRHSHSGAVQMVVSESGIGFDTDGLIARIPSKPVPKVVREALTAAGCPPNAPSIPEPAWRSEYSFQILEILDSGTDATASSDSQPRRAVLRATPVSPTGYASREPIVLDLGEVIDSDESRAQEQDTGRPLVAAAATEGGVGFWELILARGSPILEIHIPEGSTMSIDACAAGMDGLVHLSQNALA